MNRPLFPESEITVYFDQFQEIADRVRGLKLDASDVLTLAYFRDGSVRVTTSDEDVEPIIVQQDIER